MHWYDVSIPLRPGMLSFPGDPVFRIDPVYRRSEGDRFNLAEITLCTHTGTHVDPPAHYLENGAAVDEIPPDLLIGPGIVLDLRGLRRIDREALREQNLHGRSRVLFKTDNSLLLREPTFQEHYTCLTDDAAELLIECGVRLAGTDYLSIEAYGAVDSPVHHKLLRAGVLIVEGLDLLDVPPGLCEIYCLPLRIVGGDGAPARVVLRRE